MLLAIASPSVLGNILAGKEVNQVVNETNRTSYGF